MGILANNDGKILRSNTTGNVIKQNYNFGNAFYSNSGVTSNANFNKTINNNFSFFIFGRNWVSGSDTSRIIEFTFVNGTSIFLARRGTTNSLRLRVVDSPDFSNIDQIDIGAHEDRKFSVCFSNGKIYYNGNLDSDISSLGFIDSYFKDKILSSFTIGASGVSLYVTDAYIIDRELTANEIGYIHNNLLGNEPLNTSNIISRYNCEKAEISGSDIIHKDNVGIYDQVIQGLPAGTLQEQLDYANLNHFEAW